MVNTKKRRQKKINLEKKIKERIKIIDRIDNLNLATDYKKNKKLYKLAADEYKRRLRVTLKKHKTSRRIFKNKTQKKYSKKNIRKILERMSTKKIQKLYFLMLDKEKPQHSTKK